jgi:A/G-specific adenine glycosylase
VGSRLRVSQIEHSRAGVSRRLRASWLPPATGVTCAVATHARSHTCAADLGAHASSQTHGIAPVVTITRGPRPLPDPGTRGRGSGRGGHGVLGCSAIYARARNLHALARHVTRDGGRGRSPPRPRRSARCRRRGRTPPAPWPASLTSAGGACGHERGAGARARVRARPRPKRARDLTRIWRIAEAVLPRTGKAAWCTTRRSWSSGPTVCTARRRHCGRCPVKRECATQALRGSPGVQAGAPARPAPGPADQQRPPPRTPGGSAARRRAPAQPALADEHVPELPRHVLGQWAATKARAGRGGVYPSFVGQPRVGQQAVESGAPPPAHPRLTGMVKPRLRSAAAARADAPADDSRSTAFSSPLWRRTS